MHHQYKLDGYNIVLDTCSGAVHLVDDVAYDIIGMYTRPYARPDLPHNTGKICRSSRRDEGRSAGLPMKMWKP